MRTAVVVQSKPSSSHGVHRFGFIAGVPLRFAGMNERSGCHLPLLLWCDQGILALNPDHFLLWKIFQEKNRHDDAPVAEKVANPEELVGRKHWKKVKTKTQKKRIKWFSYFRQLFPSIRNCTSRYGLTLRRTLEKIATTNWNTINLNYNLYFLLRRILYLN